MKLAEYQRLRRQLQNEFDEKIRALDMVFQMSGGSPQKEVSPTENNKPPMRQAEPTLFEAPSDGSPYGGIVKVARQGVEALAGKFTVENLDDWILQHVPQYKRGKQTTRRSILAHFLRRMVERENKLSYVTKGQGGKPSVFEKI